MKKVLSAFSAQKIIACLLAFGMLAALAACSDSDAASSSDDADASIKGIVGTWNEVSTDPRVLTVSDDATYTLDEDEKGSVKVDYEEHPDGSKTAWYTFTTDNGEFWASFPKDEENEVQNDMWSGQDGEMHFMRDGIDEHLTAESYLHVWSCGRCYITFEKQKKGYLATVSWSSSAAESTQWTYNCTFDEESGAMVCKKGATRVELTVSENGSEKVKTVYKNGSGSFLIKSGTLRWTDDKENAGGDICSLQLPEEDSAD